MDLRSPVLAALSEPTLAFVCLLLGILAVYFELLLPGAVLPGSLGGVLILVSLYCLSRHPISPLGVALLLLSALLLLAEARFPSFGLVGLLGLASLVAGAARLVDAPRPIHPAVATLAGAPVAALTVLLTRLALRAWHNKAL